MSISWHTLEFGKWSLLRGVLAPEYVSGGIAVAPPRQAPQEDRALCSPWSALPWRQETPRSPSWSAPRNWPGQTRPACSQPQPTTAGWPGAASSARQQREREWLCRGSLYLPERRAELAGQGRGGRSRFFTSRPPAGLSVCFSKALPTDWESPGWASPCLGRGLTQRGP